MSESNKENILRVVRGSFKKFTMLKQNVRNDTIYDLMQFNILDRAKINMHLAKCKWKERSGYDMEITTEEIIPLQSKKPRLLPKELSEVINLMTAKCPKCTKAWCNPTHMASAHSISIPSYKEIIAEVEKRITVIQKSKWERKRALQYLGSFITPYIDDIKKHLND